MAITITRRRHDGGVVRKQITSKYLDAALAAQESGAEDWDVGDLIERLAAAGEDPGMTRSVRVALYALASDGLLQQTGPGRFRVHPSVLSGAPVVSREVATRLGLDPQAEAQSLVLGFAAQDAIKALLARLDEEHPEVLDPYADALPAALLPTGRRAPGGA